MCQAFKYANNVTKMYSLRFIVTVADHQQQDQFDNDQEAVTAVYFFAI